LFGLGCAFPCRNCDCPRSNLYNPDISNCTTRDGEEASVYLKGAYSIFCKKVQGLKLNDREKDVLNYCKGKSIHPLELAVMKLNLPFPGYSVYDYYRPDLLHTLIGLLKKWVFMTVVCVARIGSELKGVLKENLSNLDDALMNFLPKHSLPYVFEKFENGITKFCQSSFDARDKLSTGGLSSIDSQKFPSLVLQMLICKLLINIVVQK